MTAINWTLQFRAAAIAVFKASLHLKIYWNQCFIPTRNNKHQVRMLGIELHLRHAYREDQYNTISFISVCLRRTPWIHGNGMEWGI